MQASLKLVLEPIFEADFQPCSYGFRPEPARARRDRRDSPVHWHPSYYEWVLEGDITACFDEIDHPALMDRVRRSGRGQARPGAGEGVPQGRRPRRGRHMRDTTTGTPQGGILSPLLANIALSVLDEHFAEAWRATVEHQATVNVDASKGCANYRLVRYADDFVVSGGRDPAHAEALRQEVAAVLSTDGPAPVGGRRR